MRAIIRPLALVLPLLMLLAGCSKPPLADPVQTIPPATEAPAPTQPAQPAEPPATAGGPRAESLFPPGDLTLEFSVWDLGAPKPEPVTEQWIREKDRTVVVYGGKPYFTWLTDDTGVWRKDPWGGGALLRYLPPVLQSGLVWKQVSGKNTIWFQLTANEKAPCPTDEIHGLSADQCWTLRVLGPGELLTYRWAEGYGPTFVWTANAAKPAASFRKEVTANRAGDLAPAARSAFLSQAPGAGGERATVQPASAGEFDQARLAALGLKTVQADFDGDGQAEQLRGLLGSFTFLPAEVLDARGNHLGDISNYSVDAQKIDLVRFDGSNRTFLQLQYNESGQSQWATIGPITRGSDDIWRFNPPYGWDVKAYGTPATRIKPSLDGTVKVEWDMGDPARHTRVRHYRFNPSPGPNGGMVKLESETYRPEAGSLVHPSEPLDVLQAAFVARWVKSLNAELPRYFDSEAAARPLREAEISEPNYTPGSVQFATITENRPECYIKTAPAKLAADNSAPFMASWGGYEWGARAWGKVTFTTAPDGRTVIDTLSIEGGCSAGG